MFIFLSITAFFVFVLLLMVASVFITKSHLSIFELNRLAGSGDEGAIKLLAAQRVMGDLLSLRKIIEILLLLGLAFLLVAAFGLAIGVFVLVIVILTYGAMARIRFLHNLSQGIYAKFANQLVGFMSSLPPYLKLFRSFSDADGDGRIYSRAELQDIVDRSVGALTDNEKKLIINSLAFPDKLVREVMTPRTKIDSIRKTEFLGPLTLDELHKLGHSRLPVIGGDIDHIVGILHLRGLLALDIKKSTTAEKAMDSKVYYIRDDQTLQHALAAFLRTHNHMFIVVNESRETVGLLSMKDVVEALLGRKIVDEFDAHDDLRAVAAREISSINHAGKKA